MDIPLRQGIDLTVLHCYNPPDNADKLYIVRVEVVEPPPNKPGHPYRMVGSFGKRVAPNLRDEIKGHYTSEAAAMRDAAALIDSKKRGGYADIGTNAYNVNMADSVRVTFADAISKVDTSRLATQHDEVKKTTVVPKLEINKKPESGGKRQHRNVIL